MKNERIAILGAGSWGTAVAIHLSHAGYPVMLWGRNQQHVREMQQARCNHRYLPDIAFPAELTPTHDLAQCIDATEYVIVAVPSHAFSDLLHQIKKPQQGLAWLTKGLNPSTHQLLSMEVAELWGKKYPVAAISGPSFAREVAQGLPTALVVAGNDHAFQRNIHTLLHQRYLRAYESNDIIGVQWCGAVKNIIAIACGISDGLNYGANAKAALITRGLAEMSRLGICIGGKSDTFMGLAGVGDLVLTCTDNQSRNRRFGLYLGQGKSVQEAEEEIGQVVEGKHNVAQVCALATQFQIEMPICHQVQALLLNDITPRQAVEQLMMRPAKEE